MVLVNLKADSGYTHGIIWLATISERPVVLLMLCLTWKSRPVFVVVVVHISWDLDLLPAHSLQKEAQDDLCYLNIYIYICDLAS